LHRERFDIMLTHFARGVTKPSVLGQQATGGLILLKRAYHEKVVDHYNNPRNVGSFDKNDPTVGTGLVGAPACGDVMKLQIKVDESSGEIVDACFKTFGCGSAIASSSLASEWIKGKPMNEAISIKNRLVGFNVIMLNLEVSKLLVACLT
jgi:hypothetical protein